MCRSSHILRKSLGSKVDRSLFMPQCFTSPGRASRNLFSIDTPETVNQLLGREVAIAPEPSASQDCGER
jgi:hypothetical protein